MHLFLPANRGDWGTVFASGGATHLTARQEGEQTVRSITGTYLDNPTLSQGIRAR